MAIDETPGNYTLMVDRGYPTGNSLGNDNRLAIHTKIKNNPDEPINVNVVESPIAPPEEIISVFNEITSVATGISSTLLTYTVPPAQLFYLQVIELGGTNIADYAVFDNATKIGRKRTWFNGGLNERLLYTQDLKRGLKFNPGDIISVTVEHDRPDPGDFEARMVGVLVG